MRPLRRYALAASLSLVCAGPVVAADAVFPAGSRIGLVPPAGMVPTKGITGFNDPKTGTAIVTLEMPAEAYPSIAASFGPDVLKSQGFILKTRETVKVGTSEALLISGDQATAGRFVPKVVLLGTAADMTALVIAQSASIDKPDNPNLSVLAALRTVAFRPPLSVEEQLAALPFRMGGLEGFRPVRVMAGNSLLLTSGPNDAVQQVEQPVLIVARSFGQVPAADQRDTFARSALTSNTFLTDVVFERSQSFRQNGSDWHEIVAKGKDARSGEAVVTMQTIRFAPDSYLRAVGIARAKDRDDALPRFRRFVDAVAPKE